jgi:hypothetical protein
VAKRAAIMIGRYNHAHQFQRARRELKFLRTRLGRVIRDIRRKICSRAASPTSLPSQGGCASKITASAAPKVYALHAPEVECIGKGKARAPYEFGCKISIATPATKPKGGQFVLHAKALHGNPALAGEAFACPVPGGLHDAEPAADLKTPLNRSSLSTRLVGKGGSRDCGDDQRHRRPDPARFMAGRRKTAGVPSFIFWSTCSTAFDRDPTLPRPEGTDLLAGEGSNRRRRDRDLSPMPIARSGRYPRPTISGIAFASLTRAVLTRREAGRWCA